MMIIGTTIVTIILDLYTAVISFTGMFCFYNRISDKSNPMRDLRPFVESQQ